MICHLMLEFSYSYNDILNMINQGTILNPDKKRVPIIAFKNEKFITIENNSDLYPCILNMFREYDAVPEFTMHLQQMSSCYYMAAGGFGSTFLRSSTLHTVTDTSNLCFYLIDSPLAVRKAYLYFKRGGYLSRAMEAFIVWLKDGTEKEVI